MSRALERLDRRIAIQLETFIEEFSNILHRNAGAMPASSTPTPQPAAAARGMHI